MWFYDLTFLHRKWRKSFNPAPVYSAFSFGGLADGRRSECSPAGSVSHPEKETQLHDPVRKFAPGKKTQISVPAVLLFHTVQESLRIQSILSAQQWTPGSGSLESPDRLSLWQSYRWGKVPSRKHSFPADSLCPIKPAFLRAASHQSASSSGFGKFPDTFSWPHLQTLLVQSVLHPTAAPTVFVENLIQHRYIPVRRTYIASHFLKQSQNQNRCAK